jgi:hypothetical protein
VCCVGGWVGGWVSGGDHGVEGEQQGTSESGTWISSDGYLVTAPRLLNVLCISCTHNHVHL